MFSELGVMRTPERASARRAVPPPPAWWSSPARCGSCLIDRVDDLVNAGFIGRDRARGRIPASSSVAERQSFTAAASFYEQVIAARRLAAEPPLAAT